MGLVAVATGAAVGETAAGAAGDEEITGLALPGGKTPAPESGTGEEPGDAVVAGDAGDVCGAACVFISSRRNALSAVLLWA